MLGKEYSSEVKYVDTYTVVTLSQERRNGQPLGTPLTSLENVQHGTSGIHNTGMVPDRIDEDEITPPSFN